MHGSKTSDPKAESSGRRRGSTMVLLERRSHFQHGTVEPTPLATGICPFQITSREEFEYYQYKEMINV